MGSLALLLPSEHGQNRMLITKKTLFRPKLGYYVTVMTVNGHPILSSSNLPYVLLVTPPRATPLPLNTGRTACLPRKKPFSGHSGVIM